MKNIEKNNFGSIQWVIPCYFGVRHFFEQKNMTDKPKELSRKPRSQQNNSEWRCYRKNKYFREEFVKAMNKKLNDALLPLHFIATALTFPFKDAFFDNESQDLIFDLIEEHMKDMISVNDTVWKQSLKKSEFLFKALIKHLYCKEDVAPEEIEVDMSCFANMPSPIRKKIRKQKLSKLPKTVTPKTLDNVFQLLHSREVLKFCKSQKK